MAILLIYNVTDGYKKGMVRKLISLVSMIVLCVVLGLTVNGISSYENGKFVNVAIVIVVLCILGIVRHLLGVVFFSAKIISKLPVIHSIDKLMGIIFGMLETVMILWTLYTVVIMLDVGVIGSLIKGWTTENEILTWMYRNNYLAYWINNFVSK
jgi:uncharacterized membrane protein required for colicin V production